MLLISSFCGVTRDGLFFFGFFSGTWGRRRGKKQERDPCTDVRRHFWLRWCFAFWLAIPFLKKIWLYTPFLQKSWLLFTPLFLWTLKKFATFHTPKNFTSVEIKCVPATTTTTRRRKHFPFLDLSAAPPIKRPWHLVYHFSRIPEKEWDHHNNAAKKRRKTMPKSVFRENKITKRWNFNQLSLIEWLLEKKRQQFFRMKNLFTLGFLFPIPFFLFWRWVTAVCWWVGWMEIHIMVPLRLLLWIECQDVIFFHLFFFLFLLLLFLANDYRNNAFVPPSIPSFCQGAVVLVFILTFPHIPAYCALKTRFVEVSKYLDRTAKFAATVVLKK